MTKVFNAVLLMAVMASGPAQARGPSLQKSARVDRAILPQSEPAGLANAVEAYPYAQGIIYQVDTAPGSVTDIVLQAGETLISVACGDTARWVIGDTTSGSGQTKRTHVLVKPFAAGLRTNAVITTDRRTYHLGLSSTPGRAMASLEWSYPQDDLLALKRPSPSPEAAAPVAAGLEVEKLNFGYVVSGDRPPWRPLRAFDDGRQTFIEFPATIGQGEAPPLFVIGRDAKIELVNYRVRDRFYVVDRIVDVAELRLGLKKQAIVRIRRLAQASGGEHE